ncbi:ABC transporter permease [Burkholderia stagnalis]|uniref:ABC transporter permease n=1 Tax=Burkholderia stagnalis TaxID=1503054 RepID=UPI00075ACA9B|nr:ABC transporter permease [Burkholderia stagnalis]KVM75038.1 ABC transporter permease [Burkholderia stagnalis]KVN09144.1 ABC transporter permease [Burkholderia stagnalis]KVO55513.1 ABC transporter permease [Burkholderia stagnalis]KVP13464.1 ABC transporter permease [Burkholderia stagnalis]KVW90619.1 ABC transporter permease [Burkholderia stagnalis]
MTGRFLRRFARAPGALAGTLFLGVAALVALSAPLWLPSPWRMAGEPMLRPLLHAGHPLGTDMLGRDVLVGLLWGARVSLFVGLAATLATFSLGASIGALAGWCGGWIDRALMGVTALFQTIPQFAVAVTIAAVLGASLESTVAAIAAASWPAIARLVRGEFIGLARREFVLAARLAGESPAALVWRQILPHVWPPLAVLAALMVATAILTESALSFLGLGDPSQMSWGFMIGAARNVMRDAWWLSIWPGLAIVATALAVNRVGEGLRHASAIARTRAERVR